MPQQRLSDLQTPALVLDKGRLRSNIERMAKRARALGVALRPHLKTPKSVHVAKLMASAGAAGFNVSTLKEAEYFFAAGLSDFYYCVPFAPNKAARAMALARRGCGLILMTDSVEGAKAAAAALEAQSEGETLAVTVEIDVDGYRTGAPLEGDDIIEAARILDASPATRFAGIMSYAGASYGETPEGAADLAARHLGALLKTKTRLVEAGLSCDMVSLGSTPAVLHARNLDGLTEVRCGVYAFQDLFQPGIGACAVDDVAVSVLASVIARQPQHNRFVIDAGGLALSKDRSTAGRSFDAFYGLVCDAATGAVIDDLVVATVSQEIGLVASKSGAAIGLSRFPVGAMVRILPNHADMTAAAYEEYAVVEGDDAVRAVWGRINRWA